MTKKNFHIPYGVVAALAMIAVNVLLYVTGMSFAPWAQYAAFAPLVIAVILCCVTFANKNEGNVTFGSVFGIGFRTIAVATVISLVWAFVAMVVFPDMKEKALENISNTMAQKGISDDIAQQSMNMTQKYFNVFMIAGVIIGNLFYGCIAALIGALVAKKNPKPQTTV